MQNNNSLNICSDATAEPDVLKSFSFPLNSVEEVAELELKLSDEAFNGKLVNNNTFFI